MKTNIDKQQLKVWIKNKYHKIVVTIVVSKNKTVCKLDEENVFNKSVLPQNLTCKAGVSEPQDGDIYDAKIGRKIAITGFLINFYGVMKGRIRNCARDIHKQLTHQYNSTHDIQEKLRENLNEIHRKIENIEVTKKDEPKMPLIKFCCRCGAFPHLVAETGKWFVRCENCNIMTELDTRNNVLNFWNKAN